MYSLFTGETVIHPDRTFCIKVIDAEADLIEVLTNHKWSLCRAFDQMACST